MKRKLIFSMWGIAIFVSQGLSQVAEGSLQSSMVIDNFDENPLGINCSPSHGETAINSLGYCIYFEKADVTLNRLQPKDDPDKALRIQYDLPLLYDWGNWLSIRNEFDSTLDLSNYSGLQLNIKVVAASNAKLRITLADLASVDDVGKKGKDELWWFDVKSQILKGTKNQWQTLTIPFSGFYESWGAGTRHNDFKLDLSKIIAYEFNIISPAGEQCKGTIEVNSLVAFK